VRQPTMLVVPQLILRLADVYHCVGSDFTLGILPQENSIFGSVVETYDLLCDKELGRTKWICGTLTLHVQHSLIVHRGKMLHDIKKVLSHEQVRLLSKKNSVILMHLELQALGQCRKFLQSRLPSAELVRVPSTAGAAEQVSKDPESFDYAAICSKLCIKLYPDIEALHEGIQDESRT
jgi:prephenate dehydratase